MSRGCTAGDTKVASSLLVGWPVVGEARSSVAWRSHCVTLLLLLLPLALSVSPGTLTCSCDELTGDAAAVEAMEVGVAGESWPLLGESTLYRAEWSADRALMECDSRGCLLRLLLAWRTKAEDWEGDRESRGGRVRLAGPLDVRWKDDEADSMAGAEDDEKEAAEVGECSLRCVCIVDQ